MTIVQGSLCALYMARSGRQGTGGGEIALAIEIRQNIWHSMFATFATWPAADIYATTSALPTSLTHASPFPRHNCHLIASFVLFYCHRETEKESEGEGEAANRSQAKHINLTHDLNSDSVFVWRLAPPTSRTQHNRGDTHTQLALAFSVFVRQKVLITLFYCSCCWKFPLPILPILSCLSPVPLFLSLSVLYILIVMQNLSS